MNSLLLALTIALITWLLFKGVDRIKGKQAGRRTEKTMPRIGTPGTITEGQVETLTKNHFTLSPDWSFEEAALVLDTTAYLRAVFVDTTGGDYPSIVVQNELLQFILQDEDLRNHIRQWGDAHRDMLDREESVSPPRDPSFERVARHITLLMSKLSPAAHRTKP